MLPFLYIFRNYYSSIAPTGHPPAHAPHEIHVASSISNLPSPSEIAPTGHPPAHAPHEIHVSLITNAIIKYLLKNMLFDININYEHCTSFIDIYQDVFCNAVMGYSVLLSCPLAYAFISIFAIGRGQNLLYIS